MKTKKMLISGMFIAALGLIPACDIVEECGTCELVTVEPGGNTTYGQPLLVCGDDLTEKENRGSWIDNEGNTNYWNCY